MTRKNLFVGGLVVLLAAGFCTQPFLFGADPNPGPPPPEGLELLIGAGWVDVSWDASEESDLADDGYRLWRRLVPDLLEEIEEMGEAMEEGDAVADLLFLEFPDDYDLVASGTGTWFHDDTVKSGEEYAYVLTVRDLSGSESAPSIEVSTLTLAPGGVPGASGGGGGGCFLSAGR